MATKKMALQASILAAPEALTVVVPDWEVDRAVDDIVGQFPAAEDYARRLGAHGMTPEEHRSVLRRELAMSAVLKRVAADAPEPDDAALRALYERTSDRWVRPERREARHIMIVCGAPAVAAQDRQARSQLEQLRARLDKDPSLFPLLARHHSECPSALHEGLLGTFPRGVLFPELEERLFQMSAGSIAGPVRTAGGWHLLRCEAIYPADRTSFASARTKLFEACQERLRKRHQRAWLEQRKAAAQPSLNDGASPGP